MKKLFFVVATLIFLSKTFAIDTSCFVLKSEAINVEPNEILEIENYYDIYPVQGDIFLPIKEIETNKKEYIDYTVVDVDGLKNAEYKYISDNNPNTFIQFINNPKTITVQTSTFLTEGTFDFYINADLFDLQELEISEDGKYFRPILLGDIESFGFEYVRLSFIDLLKNSKSTLFAPTKIRDLLFVKRGLKKQIIKSISSEPIFIYSRPYCNNKYLEKEMNMAYLQGEKTKMGISASTKKITPILKENSSYNRDIDGDTIPNRRMMAETYGFVFDDNCPLIANPDQKDTDKDLIGDVCDIDPKNRNPLLGDSDSDGVDDERDNCPFTRNADQSDENSNGRGDACSDDDGDGLLGSVDNCPSVPNTDQKDVNVNNVGDVCESDRDKDGFFDTVDVCPGIGNPDQRDSDSDGIGDLCDNCNRYNPDQRDENNDKKGDVCSEWEAYEKSHDDDGDSVINWEDNCPKVSNPKTKIIDPKTGKEITAQPDRDYDGIGDMCDNCVHIQNHDQADINKNNQGDMCEDMDGDGRQSYQDNCPLDSNADQADKNNDGVGDFCDDTDGDSIRASVDNCPYVYNPEQLDSDDDTRGDKCDEKDNRFLESNKNVFIALFALIGIGMLVGVIVLGKKLLSSH